MSNFSRSQINEFVSKEIKKIIPLDDESISQMVGYSISNLKSREELYNHFSNLLGESPEMFEFVSKFGDILFGESIPDPEIEKVIKKPGTKSVKLVSTNGSRTKIVRKKVINKTSDGKVIPNQQRLKNNSNSGSMTSDLFDMTPKKKEKLIIKKNENNKKLSNIDEIDDVLTKIEIMNSINGNDGDIRICNCNATRHPLFEMYPNCLNCGKIICEKEGAQPCSFCGKPLMSQEERDEVIELLKREKRELEGIPNIQNEETKQLSKPRNRKNIMKISLNNVGQNNYKVQDQFFKMVDEKNDEERANSKQREEDEKEIEENEREMKYWNSQRGKDPELLKAEERLEMLLNFQDDGTERTKIIDNAADFEAPTNGSLWASPLERALQLKRQQKTAQRLDEMEKQRSGRGDIKVDVIIKNGKAIIRRSEQTVDSAYEELSDDEEVQELKAQLKEAKSKTKEQDVLPFYDYKVVAEEYVKPVYLGEIKSSNASDLSSPTSATSPIVQITAEEAEAALFSMVGI